VYEPVALQDFMVAVIAGAMVILFGALYAFTYAVAKLKMCAHYLDSGHKSAEC
jgi:hypothetical protein